ncbi:hypothetical protein FA95DRAFT_1372629 [Auriscalpium vulgare]|uniref:Uncharacterized protein n=1 Tax=Auriscalpium vulgare TaxID=40419 RepID=A0ACB8RR90_9AGAM|nr:hypothetical protein FA95DRAFT_1372629 [Auriscalpium vulgare]
MSTTFAIRIFFARSYYSLLSNGCLSCSLALLKLTAWRSSVSLIWGPSCELFDYGWNKTMGCMHLDLRCAQWTGLGLARTPRIILKLIVAGAHNAHEARA